VVRAAAAAGIVAASWASGAGAQVPEVARESPGQHAWELGATAGSLRIDGDLAAGAAPGWVTAAGARAAWRPAPMAAIAVEAWRAELDPADGAESPLEAWAAGIHLRVRPAASRGWPLEPALDFGIMRLAVDDDEERGALFAAGGGLLHAARRWTAGVSVRNHRLRVEQEPVPVEGGSPVATGRDAVMWEVRAELAIVLGGDGG